ncbi:efflux RND transporter periplasmic adaptor subunit [Lentibacillus sp. Marseille-P4043]|uniref:efflux RND transporter periplasmic adaptor subunit n=1 Tax=Lentibacillus sp. Marseille-P4043 TaxID=2040293 RepID=UPI000D0B9FE2|nr:efflux RND transporter periplasmic adaptor subunit [Lentibacillus sp. Marseille-P4043]
MKKTFLIVLSFVCIGLLAACNQEDETKEDKKDKVTAVETAKVEQGNLVIDKSFYGRTAPESSTPVMVANPAELTTLKVENGDTVDEDDLIATVGGRNIYAPTSGEIANLTAEEDSIVSNSDPLAVIIDLDSLKLQFTVTADELKLFKKEATYNAIIDGEKIEAEITSIAKLPNDTGLYPVEATIDNDDDAFLPGVVAELQIPEKKVKDAIIVPTEAIIEEGGESFIYVVEDDKAVKKDVTVTETQSDRSAIKGEVKKGENVITSGQLTLQDGSKVNVVKEGNAS